MFYLYIVADLYLRNGELVDKDHTIHTGSDYDGQMGEVARAALEKHTADLDQRNASRDEVAPPVLERNHRVRIHKSNMIKWGHGDLRIWGCAAFSDIKEDLANHCILDENWQEVEVTDEDEIALGEALRGALAKWAEDRGVPSNVWGVDELLGEWPLVLNDEGYLVASDEVLAELDKLK